MRRYLPLGTICLIAAAVAGCGGSSTAAPSTATPIPTGRPVGLVSTIPATTPPPVIGRKGTKKKFKGPVLKALPTTKPYTTYATPTPFPARAYTAVLHGTVTDAKTGSPVSGALVAVGQLPRHTTRTNSFGEYRITFPAGPDVAVQVTRDGFAGDLAIGHLKSGESLKLNFKLAPASPNKPVAPSPPMVFGSH